MKQVSISAAMDWLDRHVSELDPNRRLNFSLITESMNLLDWGVRVELADGIVHVEPLAVFPTKTLKAKLMLMGIM